MERMALRLGILLVAMSLLLRFLVSADWGSPTGTHPSIALNFGARLGGTILLVAFGVGLVTRLVGGDRRASARRAMERRRERRAARMPDLDAPLYADPPAPPRDPDPPLPWEDAR